MKHYFITGTGSGLGKALAELLLSEHKVTGISRSNSISHPNFTFIQADLSRPGSVEKIALEFPSSSDEVVLINNAGMIGEIDRVGSLSNSHYEQLFHLNVIALTQLCDRFLSRAKNKNYPCLIINISSGAAKSAIPSWAAYCASKAAVDAFTEVLAVELKEVGADHIRAFSFYPGIIDTPMQAHIRTANASGFSSLIRFQEYKNKGELHTPAFVAEKLLGIFRKPETITTTVVNLREYC